MNLSSAVRRRYVDTPGGPLAALTTGTAGPAVLLVPGFTGSKEDFRLVLEPLAGAGFSVTALDLRGQYESAGPPDRAAYTIEALAADVLVVLDALGAPVHVVGHSFGGLVARAAVLQRPSAVRSLTLMASGPSALAGPRVQALELMRPLLESGGLLAVADALEALSPADDPRPPELRAFLRRRFLASSAEGLLAMAAALGGEPDRVDELAASGVPVLVLYGESDDAWSPSVQAAMAGRLRARTAVIPAAVHAPAVENPAATVAALISFFSSAQTLHRVAGAAPCDP